jgi:hypothetical protein
MVETGLAEPIPVSPCGPAQIRLAPWPVHVECCWCHGVQEKRRVAVDDIAMASTPFTRRTTT